MARRDIEETDEELDTYQGDPLRFWESKQRELVTSVVDYNLSTLAELIRDEVIDLAPKYQRRFRWGAVRQSKLIESFLMNVPVPPIFLNEDEYGHYSVIDGKQRLMAISEFFGGRLVLQGLGVFQDLNGLTFYDLPRSLKQVLRTRPILRAVIVLRQSDQDIKFEVFQRLNTGGVSLNPQEIRNSTYPGPLNDLIVELSEMPAFHRLLGIKRKATSTLYTEMRDAELVLRFFTFKDNWASFAGGMKRYMDSFMANNWDMSEDQLAVLRMQFIRTLELVEAAFDDCAFRRWVPETSRWRNQVLAALYDAEMFSCFELGPRHQELRNKHDEIVSGLQWLFANEDFRRSIDGATNTPSYFKSRIKTLLDMMVNAIGG